MLFCAAENCENEAVYNSGLCNAHYQRWKLYGRLETVVWGQSSHPLYNLWNERKNRNQLCEEWTDFKKFLEGVGERPGDDYRLKRKLVKEVYGPNNFYWKKLFERKEEETLKEFNRRKRLEDIENHKTYELRKSFGITYDHYQEMLKAQNFVCKICEYPEVTIHHVSGNLKSLAVDHCHSTGKIRGLLCQRCNRVLGKVRDNIELLDKMKAYLNAHN